MPQRLRYNPFHESKGLGKKCQLFRGAIPTAGGIPTHGGWRQSLVFIALKSGVEIEHDKSKCTPFYCCVVHYRKLAYKISACEVCMIWRKPTETCKNPLPIAESRTGKPAMVALKIQPDCLHGPWHDPVGEHLCAQQFRMWNRLCFHPFLQVSQIFQRHKSDTNTQDFENKLYLTCQAQSPPKGS